MPTAIDKHRIHCWQQKHFHTHCFHTNNIPREQHIGRIYFNIDAYIAYSWDENRTLVVVVVFYQGDCYTIYFG